jgi:hypothetical protein
MKGKQWKHSTFNIKHSTLKAVAVFACLPLNVGR